MQCFTKIMEFSFQIAQISSVVSMAPLFTLTVKALLSPRGAYLISDLPEGGLNREGAY